MTDYKFKKHSLNQVNLERYAPRGCRFAAEVGVRAPGRARPGPHLPGNSRLQYSMPEWKGKLMKCIFTILYRGVSRGWQISKLSGWRKGTEV